MEIDEILKEFRRHDYKFPRQALQEAIARQAEITPHLLAILEPLTVTFEPLRENVDDMSAFYAWYLLAQFREAQAYPLIYRIFSQVKTSDDHDLFGEFITEDLDSLLASVCGGDTSLIEQLAVNPELEQYVRGAALDAQLCLVVSGYKSREAVMAYYKSLFHSQPRIPHYFWDSLISSTNELYPEEAREEIRAAFADDLARENILDWKWVEKTLAQGKEATLAKLQQSPHHQLINDTIEELEYWACFQLPDDSWRRQEPAPIPQPTLTPARTPHSSPTAAGTFVNLNRKVGRNDPCTCGSGKKFKKCCG